MAAQVFWAVQPTAEPKRPNSWFRRCCHSTPYIFHVPIAGLFIQIALNDLRDTHWRKLGERRRAWLIELLQNLQLAGRSG